MTNQYIEDGVRPQRTATVLLQTQMPDKLETIKFETQRLAINGIPNSVIATKRERSSDKLITVDEMVSVGLDQNHYIHITLNPYMAKQ